MLWSVLITGPEDTPYDGGAFVFDAFFPSGYPIAAPRLKFRTTGGGRVRFNPNLYKDGKVCRSLLGTWSGARGRLGDPAVSTMLQVIVSVQSLIFVPRPYFNEPGYEQSIGTADGDAKCAEYNAFVREETMSAQPSWEDFETGGAAADAIRAHFKRRAAHILGPNVRGRVDGSPWGRRREESRGSSPTWRRNWRNCEGDNFFPSRGDGRGVRRDEDASALRETADGTEMFGRDERGRNGDVRTRRAVFGRWYRHDSEETRERDPSPPALVDSKPLSFPPLPTDNRDNASVVDSFVPPRRSFRSAARSTREGVLPARAASTDRARDVPCRQKAGCGARFADPITWPGEDARVGDGRRRGRPARRSRARG